MRGWWSRISQLAVFIVMGAMIVSIGLDTAWKSLMPVPSCAGAGIAFAVKSFLRTGIVLTGPGWTWD